MFKDIIIKINDKNLGPYKTCLHANDFAYKFSDFVIFSEDDSIFCNDTLNYYDFFKNSNLIDNEEIIGITSYSCFFHKKDLSSDIDINSIKNRIISNNDLNSVIKVKSIPNKQWGMFKKGWNKVRCIRENGGTDYETLLHVIENNYHFIYSIVPRTNDIGLFHKLGCTTLYYKKKIPIDTIKFITSDDFDINFSDYNLKNIDWNKYVEDYTF